MYAPSEHEGHQTTRYPGGAYVDIVGENLFGPLESDCPVEPGYARLLALGKPYGIPQFGPGTNKPYSFAKLMPCLQRSYPAAVFVVAFSGIFGFDDPTYTHQSAFMDNPRTVTRGRLPRHRTAGAHAHRGPKRLPERCSGECLVNSADPGPVHVMASCRVGHAALLPGLVTPGDRGCRRPASRPRRTEESGSLSSRRK